MLHHSRAVRKHLLVSSTQIRKKKITWFALCINASIFLLLVKLPDEVRDTPTKRKEKINHLCKLTFAQVLLTSLALKKSWKKKSCSCRRCELGRPFPKFPLRFRLFKFWR